MKNNKLKTVSIILAELDRYGVEAERKGIYNDIALLRGCGD